MNINDVLINNKKRIIDDLNCSINFGMYAAHINAKKTEEPDYIASLVLKGFPKLFYSLKKIFKENNIDISMAAVYCHQKPEVEFLYNDNKCCCELGDLLIVHKHGYSNGKSYCNALLLQAKLSDSFPITLNINDNQLVLYTNWPTFKYNRTSKLTGTYRSVTPCATHSGAKYLLLRKCKYNNKYAKKCLTKLFYINKNITHVYCESDCLNGEYKIIMDYVNNNDKENYTYCSVPNIQLDKQLTFSDEVFNFLNNKSGRKFSLINRNNGNWSNVVYDILNYGINNNFNRNNICIKKEPRYKGDKLINNLFVNAESEKCLKLMSTIMNVNSKDLLKTINGVPSITENYTGNNGDNEMSFVLIETSENDRDNN